LSPLSARRGVLLGTPNDDNYFGSSISSWMVTKRKSRIESDGSASYVVPGMQLSIKFYTNGVLLSIHMRFGLVPERWILRYVQCFGLDHCIWHNIRTTLWLRCSTRLCSSRSLTALRKATIEEDDRRIWIKYCDHYLRFFSCVTWIYCVN
jgi:hypothetical protein